MYGEYDGEVLKRNSQNWGRVGTAIFPGGSPTLSNLVKKKIKFSRDFCAFCVLEAARCKFEETIVGIKVVYVTYKHFRSVRYEKWSYYGYFLAVKPFQTATFLVIYLTRLKCLYVSYTIFILTTVSLNLPLAASRIQKTQKSRETAMPRNVAVWNGLTTIKYQ